MTETDFWGLIGAVDAEAGFDNERKEAALARRLEALPLVDLRAFSHRFDEAMDRAYDWGLWAAAWVVRGGCSDDSFDDFRSTLLLLGRAVYEAALRDPDSLADVLCRAPGAEALYHENFGFVVNRVWRARTGEPYCERLRRPPREPSGTSWAEDDEAYLARLLPRIWAEHRWRREA